MTNPNPVPLWQRMQGSIEEGVMAPPVGSIFGPNDYARGIESIIDYLTDKWKQGYDTSTAVQLLRHQKMVADGTVKELIG